VSAVAQHKPDYQESSLALHVIEVWITALPGVVTPGNGVLKIVSNVPERRKKGYVREHVEVVVERGKGAAKLTVPELVASKDDARKFTTVPDALCWLDTYRLALDPLWECEVAPLDPATVNHAAVAANSHAV
jgi:hypothetical protein